MAQTIAAGTYIAASRLSFGSSYMSVMKGEFTSNLGFYAGMYIYLSLEGVLLYGSMQVYVTAEGSDLGFTGWKDNAYRIITIENDIIVSDANFADWFNLNFTAVQGGGYHIPAGDYIGVAQPYCYLNGGIDISFTSDSLERTGMGIYSSFGGIIDYSGSDVYQCPNGSNQVFTSWKNEAVRSIHVTEDAYLSSKDAWTQFCRIFAPVEVESGDSGGSGASITYNGSTIATLEAGQMATLQCAGKKMSGDVVVSAK